MEKINKNSSFRDDVIKFLVDWGLDDILEEYFQTQQFDNITSTCHALMMQKIELVQSVSEFSEDVVLQYELQKFKEEIKFIVKFQIFSTIHELVKEDPNVKKIVARSLQKNCYKSLVRETWAACENLVSALVLIYWNNVLFESVYRIIIP